MTAPAAALPAAQANDKPALEIRNVSRVFGGLTAVSDFSLRLAVGELVGLIGPNGAGKTTCFNVMTGVYTPTAGEVRFNGKVPKRGKFRVKVKYLGDERTHRGWASTHLWVS